MIDLETTRHGAPTSHRVQLLGAGGRVALELKVLGQAMFIETSSRGLWLGPAGPHTSNPGARGYKGPAPAAVWIAMKVSG